MDVERLDGQLGAADQVLSRAVVLVGVVTGQDGGGDAGGVVGVDPSRLTRPCRCEAWTDTASRAPVPQPR